MVEWEGCWHYNDARRGHVWALLLRHDATYQSHVPRTPEGQWWVAAIAIHRDELQNGYTDCEYMTVAECLPTQTVNVVVRVRNGVCQPVEKTKDGH